MNKINFRTKGLALLSIASLVMVACGGADTGGVSAPIRDRSNEVSSAQRTADVELALDVAASFLLVGDANDEQHVNADGTTTIYRKAGAARQKLTVIHNAQQPTEFTYAMDVPEGGSLHVNENGTAVVVDARGAPTVVVAPAWALDADGNAVATSFRADGDKLVQIVEHNRADVRYPVVSDPFWIPAWVMIACGIGFLSGGLGYWVSSGWSLWRFLASGAVGCVFGIIGKKF